MKVVGTAGHVDHGKSTLVQALTGTHPDRLKEEREREMTIDLGFAYLDLPNGDAIGIVDVPGHRDFIENMLSGVGGIDAALFVVAADEGVMPQTREHLAILDLLDIQAGLVALTKTDLVDDPEWLDLVEEELLSVFEGTVLEDAEIVRVSAPSGAGIDELREALSELLSNRPDRPDLGRPRLPIDRAFTMAGFGTVVTGTLTDGSFKPGQDVQVLPAGYSGRIRGLQTHGHVAEHARPGSRTAINISGLSLLEAMRGSWIVGRDHYQASRRLDLEFRQLQDISKPIQHDLEVKLFIGAAEVLGRLRLLGTDSLGPGESGWIQVELREPVVAVRGDRYILRRPSPGETLGGGSVVDPFPAGRHRRFDDGVLERLSALSGGSPDDLLLQAARAVGPADIQTILDSAGLPAAESSSALAQLLESGALVRMSSGRSELILEKHFKERAVDDILMQLEKFHQAAPLRPGMPRGELKNKLALDGRLFDALLAELETMQTTSAEQAVVRLAGHSITFDSSQQTLVDELKSAFRQSPYAPPSVKESRAALGDDLFEALIDLEKVTVVSADVVFWQSDFDEMLVTTRAAFASRGELTVADIRDLFGTTRKYALAFSEYMDQIGITERIGDSRRLKS